MAAHRGPPPQQQQQQQQQQDAMFEEVLSYQEEMRQELQELKAMIGRVLGKRKAPEPPKADEIAAPSTPEQPKLSTIKAPPTTQELFQRHLAAKRARNSKQEMEAEDEALIRAAEEDEDF
eukprot:TRINITY_DN2834_c0_g2_i1.p2 TRINITY_DN2834_c0_g2~~TRINITY_DN2834_c0_g2_i1.p2  ORF type:complete len:120 (-),score=34.65 TRINITY_DN2834_c0_g2_i1:154-513(-)